jgi:hypothetical protein
MLMLSVLPSYICFNDLTDLLGHAPDTLENLNLMWAESMLQCKCKDGRINYDDFLLLMKGQTRRRESGRPSMVWSPAAILEEMKNSFHDDPETSAFVEGDHNRIPPTIPEFEPVTSEQGRYVRKRSYSFNDASVGASRRSKRVSFPPRVAPRPSLAAGGDLVHLIAADSKAPLLATREEYKRHRDIRTAILRVSKEFDIKSQARRAAIEGQKESNSSVLPAIGAGLIMKRGSLAPPELESEHERMLFDAAVRRGGRHAHSLHAKSGHRKKRTHSDITGMLMQSVGQSIGEQ